jgi:hypothetical protein
VWAYESRKYISESVLRDYPIRWQMQMFMDSGRFNISGYQKEQFSELLQRLRRATHEMEASGRASPPERG